MIVLSYPRIRWSMCLLISVGALTLASLTPCKAAPLSSSDFYGRWTVAEDQPMFTARGKLYKTIDVLPCGKNFCGVSVSDQGQCGDTLFRLATIHTDNTTTKGHGKWGDKTKNIEIYLYQDTSDANAINGAVNFELYLGDGHDFDERSGNMPKFHAEYKRLGDAKCGGS